MRFATAAVRKGYLRQSSYLVTASLTCLGLGVASKRSIPAACESNPRSLVKRYTSTTAAPSPDDIVRYWFGDDCWTTEKIPFRMSWFVSTPAVDAAINEQFGGLVAAAMSGGLTEWEGSAKGLLAKIILLDQFTRNTYRGLPKAFDGDLEAQRLSLLFCAHPDAAQLPEEMRWFALMPFVHAENITLQKKGLEEFAKLALWSSIEKDIMKHYVIVERFGRYPHRNAILGRANTTEEAAFLAGDAESFGQKK